MSWLCCGVLWVGFCVNCFWGFGLMLGGKVWGFSFLLLVYDGLCLFWVLVAYTILCV
ncbi:hypothetical protein BDV25DRAFT_153451 [Aspergillus avenaceus]|uniref:Uncharacterized protein n=1 Tax=Aspergillus avenaceus TaxID=36643 RepID=A0A5N6TXB6_ASPAV|nr:hypothetical protein BDV25DRAFT_153451 [Aspergillus avenaceus]